jgi:hypothetical protein
VRANGAVSKGAFWAVNRAVSGAIHNAVHRVVFSPVADAVVRTTYDDPLPVDHYLADSLSADADRGVP